MQKVDSHHTHGRAGPLTSPPNNPAAATADAKAAEYAVGMNLEFKLFGKIVRFVFSFPELSLQTSVSSLAEFW